MELSPHLQGILATLPAKPGCYLMKNSQGTIIYVGKAVNLKNRVRSYFHADSSHDNKTRRLVREISDIEWIVVGSELEALILEMNLIKRHRPKYNVRLKDDKRYPYIKVHWSEAYPKVTVTRQMVEDGSRYFGPYTSAWAVYQTLDVLRKVFPYLTCDREITGQDKRACLYYDIKLCAGPCIGAIDQAAYRRMIADLMSFLEGRSEDLLARLMREMEQAAEELRFERAAVLRDRLKALQAIIERQKVVFGSDYKDSDVVAMARADGEACVQIFFIRGGKLIGREYFVVEGTEDTPDAEVIASFLKQFYTEAASVPQQVMLPEEIEEARIIQEWLRSRRGGEKVEMFVPKEGTPHELDCNSGRRKCCRNAAFAARPMAGRYPPAGTGAGRACNRRSTCRRPNRIECYDVSHTQGVATVGAMVVFEQGVPVKRLYRKFNIDSTSIGNPDDFASMEEMLTRRFRRWQSAQEAQAQTPGAKTDEAFARLPDLIIIDGGKGQLGRAVRVLEQYGLAGSVPVVGHRQARGEIFFPHKSESLRLPRHSRGAVPAATHPR